jgi:hypothetical protein
MTKDENERNVENKANETIDLTPPILPDEEAILTHPEPPKPPGYRRKQTRTLWGYWFPGVGR